METHIAIPSERLREVVDRYESRGYQVTIGPGTDMLPEFLREFHPDALAVSPDESVVVELKRSHRSRPVSYWNRLTQAVRAHPGWRLDFVAGPDPDGPFAEIIPNAEIVNQLNESVRLAKTHGHAGLLLGWAAAEAAMRLTCRRSGNDPAGFSPAAVVGRLYSDGALDREDYDELLRIMQVRNRVAHGLQSPPVDPQTVIKLRDVAMDLLAQ